MNLQGKYLYQSLPSRIISLGGLLTSLILFSLITIPIFAQQWVNLNPFDQPPANTFYGIDFVDEHYGWCVGEWGLILHTSDGGNKWDIQRNLLIRGTFTSVDFVDRENGWIVGGGGYIFYTKNGGLSWERQKSPVNYDLYDVFFLNHRIGWAAGYGTLLHTKDGGEHWHIQGSVSFEYSLQSVFFVDSLRGWIAGVGGLILHTEDGGQTWQQQNSGLEWVLNEIQFSDSLNGWACGCSTIRTTNGGESWRKVDDKSAESIFVISEKEAFVVGWSGQDGFMKYTIDGGFTWLDSNFGSRNYLFDVIFLDRNTGWAVGRMGLIINTIDGGKTWSVQHERKIDCSLDGTFINSSEGWMTALGELPQKLYHTTNGGNTWEVQMAKDSIFYSNIIFVNDYYGWMKVSKWIGPYQNYEHYLWKTSDAGKTWQTVSTPLAFEAFFFVDTLLGFSGGDTKFCKTTDGGESWHNSSLESGASIGTWDIYFPNQQYGWAVGGHGIIFDIGSILKTTDGGETWKVNVAEASATGRGVYFTDSLHGVVVGSNPPFFEGVIMWTEDGGDNWEVQYLPCSWLNDVVFTDDSTGWAVGDLGFIWKTEDGGKTWERVKSGTAVDLNRIVFVENGRVGYIFGKKNTLLRYESTSNVVEDKKNAVPMNHRLYPNYPNPFNSETRIEYELAEGGIVYVRIFDLTGKEVVTLEDGRLSSGKHAVKWNGKDKFGQEVSSGVYVINLKTRNSSQARKICLIH